ncbi:MAG: TfoX/Sxy family protein [Methanocorpusculum sp.]|nr:TfoX/Sxy family protein [Methanocorpusculum sp.]
MASDKEYLDFIIEQLEGLEITYRKMMGEYIIYCGGKIIGGVYDNRFLVKPTVSALKLLPNPHIESPYSGAKDMIAPDVDDGDSLKILVKLIADDIQ